MTRWTHADLAAVRGRLYGPDGQLPSRKYRNQPQLYEGERFDSKLELKRYMELRTMQAAQLISELKVHPEFALHSPDPNGIPKRVCAYIADFSYQRDGKLVVEDVKSAPTRQTAIYQLKRHMMEIEWGISVVEILRGASRSC